MMSFRRNVRVALIGGALTTALAIGAMFLHFQWLIMPGYVVALLVGGGLDYVNPVVWWVVMPVVNWIFYSILVLSVLALRRRLMAGTGDGSAAGN